MSAEKMAECGRFTRQEQRSGRPRHLWGVYAIQQTSSKLPANVMLDDITSILSDF